MNALATALQFNVIVHQVDNPSMAQLFHHPADKFPVLHISYHLGEHYNSVRRIDDDMIKGWPPIQTFPIGADLDKVKDLVNNHAIQNGGGKKKKGGHK